MIFSWWHKLRAGLIHTYFINAYKIAKNKMQNKLWKFNLIVSSISFKMAFTINPALIISNLYVKYTQV